MKCTFIICLFFSAALNKSSMCITCCSAGETSDRRCFGIVALSNPPGLSGSLPLAAADKNNPLTIFNSCRPFGEQSLDAFLPVAKGLQRLCAKTALFHWFPPTTTTSKKLRDNGFNKPSSYISHIYRWNRAGQCVDLYHLSSLICCLVISNKQDKTFTKSDFNLVIYECVDRLIKMLKKELWMWIC